VDETAFERAKALFFEGNACFAAGRFAAAEERFEAALALVPGRASTLANLGAARVRGGRPREALPVLAQALALEPDDLQSIGHQAMALAALGRHAEALASFDRVLAAEPEHVASWLGRGEALRFLERHDEALVAFERANALAPTLAVAWTQRGSILRDRGQIDAARHAFEQAIAHGGDPELNGYFLAALSGANAPAQAPAGYVLRFFDEYAPSFDAHLVRTLGYRAPAMLVEQIVALGPRRFASALDLGCGTGLCGPLLRPLCDRLEGVDLSERMLGQAAMRGVYDALTGGELVAHLASSEERRDLLVAADVFIYIGALAPVFEGAARVLDRDGLFAFTAEACADEASDVVLLPSLRYAHSEEHLRALAAEHGFAIASIVRAPLRKEQGNEVEGLYVVLRR
jgi:predicted TPR repeat methyltransferase